MSHSDLKTEVLETLSGLHAAQDAGDLDAMVGCFAEDGFQAQDLVRSRFEALLARDAFRDRTVDVDRADIYVHRGAALVKPVLYRRPDRVLALSFHLARHGDGTWRIIDSNRSVPPGEAVYSDQLMATAGRLVGLRGMVWTRRFAASPDQVWAAISTKDGLDKWWVSRDVQIDLRPGGLFRHHWTNTVRDVRPMRSIEFGGDASIEQDNAMRFDMAPDGDGTVFSFFDAFNMHALPLSQPWTCAGWHSGMDALEASLTGRSVETDFGLAGEFYFRYLRRHHRLAALSDRAESVLSGDETAAGWREGLLAEPV